MIGRRAALAATLCMTLGGASCERGSSFPPSDLSFDAFCSERLAALDALYARCENVHADALYIEPCPSEAARVAAGRLLYDRSRGAGCVRGLQTESCQDLRGMGTLTCVDVLQAPLAVGAACATDDECAGNTFCDLSGGSCPGVCRDRLADGADCTAAPLTCGIRSSCVPDATGSKCRALVGPGGACGPGTGDCVSWYACLPAGPGGSGAFAGSSTCQPRLHVGDACSMGADACPFFAVCGASGTCAVTDTITPIGGACTAATVCARGSGCVSGVCTDCAPAL